jgi:chemotaxis protein methyltransferase CheR
MSRTLDTVDARDMTTLCTSMAELSESQFNTISDFVKNSCGINLHDGKKELVKARLSKRLRVLGMTTFEQYINFLGSAGGAGEITLMLDALSTNLTFFFREVKHLNFLRDTVLPELAKQRANSRRLRIWSAGCSSGEEPYSIAVIMHEVLTNIAGWNTGILATDLSTRMLARAKDGIYEVERFREMPRELVSRYFHASAGDYAVNDTLRRIVTFARLNLMHRWPMSGPFDVIFCRNVMIYFDKPTQSRLVERFSSMLSPGGYLFIGHSESLAGVQHQLSYVQPTVYQKA